MNKILLLCALSILLGCAANVVSQEPIKITELASGNNTSGINQSNLQTKKWAHGAIDCELSSELALDELSLDDSTLILRQSKCLTFEAPFMYLFKGTEKALLFDTGAVKDSEASGLLSRVQDFLKNDGDDLPLLVIHSHGHSDHKAGDVQFLQQNNTNVFSTKNEMLMQDFGISNWPEDFVEIDLGGRVIKLIPSPGHHDDGITIYDPKHKLLLTGDTFYPGQIFVKNWSDYQQSIKRLTDFSSNNLVDFILGGHIEMKAAAGEMYPIGTVYQPSEHPLPLSKQHLQQLNHALQNQDGAVEIIFDDFIVTPLGIVPKTLGTIFSWFSS